MSLLKKTGFALLVGLVVTANVSASTVTYTFSANVSLEIRGNQLATADQLFFTPFAEISGSFDYDNSAAPIAVAEGTVYESIFNLTGSIENNSFSDPSGGTLVINDGLDLDPNDPNNPLTDLFSIGAEGGPVANLSGFTVSNTGSVFALVNVRLFWINPNGGFIDNEMQLEQLAPQTEIARLALDFVDIANGDITHTVFAEPLLLNASPVPVPAAVWLFLSGLGFLGLNRRRS